MCTNKNTAIADFVNRVIKNSWTFDRLTPQEREQVLLLLANIRSTAKTTSGVSKVVDKVYSEFLDTLGYKPTGWRESRRDVSTF
jgi:hypothetical protein